MKGTARANPSQGAFRAAESHRRANAHRERSRQNVDHPAHYNAHPSGVECIDIVEWMNFNVGNAVKYLWRADLKNGLEDLRKAEWYIRREIQRREKSE